MTTCAWCKQLFDGLSRLCNDCQNDSDDLDEPEEEIDCPRCNGSGEIESMDYTDEGFETCYSCNGSGVSK